jgi:hypothetical protein
MALLKALVAFDGFLAIVGVVAFVAAVPALNGLPLRDSALSGMVARLVAHLAAGLGAVVLVVTADG